MLGMQTFRNGMKTFRNQYRNGSRKISMQPLPQKTKLSNTKRCGGLALAFSIIERQAVTHAQESAQRKEKPLLPYLSCCKIFCPTRSGLCEAT